MRLNGSMFPELDDPAARSVACVSLLFSKSMLPIVLPLSLCGEPTFPLSSWLSLKWKAVDLVDWFPILFVSRLVARRLLRWSVIVARGIWS